MKRKRPHIIADPVIPFSFSQSPKAPKPKWMCSECRMVFFGLFVDAQNHIESKHPFHSPKKKRTTHKKSRRLVLPIRGIINGRFIP